MLYTILLLLDGFENHFGLDDERLRLPKTLPDEQMFTPSRYSPSIRISQS